MSCQNEARRAGDAAGPRDLSSLAADSSEIAPKLATAQSYSRKAPLQFPAAPLRALGPKPLFHFIDELERGADLRVSLDAYATLSAEFIKSYAGDRFAPALHAIDGGRS